jgi:hypothetical protein
MQKKEALLFQPLATQKAAHKSNHHKTNRPQPMNMQWEGGEGDIVSPEEGHPSPEEGPSN